jgi:proteic killer suppression protein
MRDKPAVKIEEFEDLRALRGSRLEALRGSRKGHFSIRIDDRYRVCFKWNEKGPTGVEIVDYHREEAATDPPGQNSASRPEGRNSQHNTSCAVWRE